MFDIKNILKGLCSISSPSGYEMNITSFLRSYLSCYDNIIITEDHIGNIIVEKKGNCNTSSIMLVAHCDEIGFAVKYIDESGFIHFSPLGGIDLSILRGRDVVIKHKEQTVCGVIGARPVSLSKNNKSKDIDISDLWIDIGASSKSEVMNAISIGDPITFKPHFNELSNNIFSSKSIDNRVGVAILMSLIDRLHNANTRDSLFFVFSVQEEVGLRGVITAGYNIHPSIGIAIDVTHATDYPTINKNAFGEIKLGKGPSIPIGPNFNGSVQRQLRAIAERKQITYQVESISGFSGTDVAELQLLRGGCQSGLLSIPCRYMHTPTEMASYDDVLSAIEILFEFCTSKDI